jgi:hypothetical protein
VTRDASGNFAAGTATLNAITLVGNNGIRAFGAQDQGDNAPAGTGTRFVWHPRKSALRAGRLGAGGLGNEWDEGNIGYYSVAFGINTLASMQASFAVGEQARATGSAAIAMGLSSTASGASAFAVGSGTVASGPASIAMGQTALASSTGSIAMGNEASASGTGAVALGLGSTASGLGSAAIGVDVVASGDASVALGSLVSTGGHSGAIVIGDNSAATALTASAANQFLVRAAGGVTLYTDAATSVGVYLSAGSGSWSSVSDRNRKRDFRSLDGDDVLARIRTMPIQEWSYITEGHNVRHVGPTAQDFRAAFGLGPDDLSISTVDIDGINLFAVQQLIERHEALKAEHAALREEVTDLRARLERLERLLDRR